MGVIEVTRADLVVIVEKALVQFREQRATRESVSQIAIEDAIKWCYNDDEIELAAVLLNCSAARVSGDLGKVLNFVLQLSYDRASRSGRHCERN